MQPLLIILLLLSVLTNVLLILLLLRSGQQNTAEDQTDEIARIVRDEVEAETEVLADQLRVMQGEVTRTTSASARDMGTLLAESQRQSQEAATARLDAIAFLHAPSFDVVDAWRCQQEETALGRTLDEIERQRIARFIAFFERITRGMLSGGRRSDVSLALDADRQVLNLRDGAT